MTYASVKVFPLTKIMANTKEQISRNMRSNKSKDTKPELKEDRKKYGEQIEIEIHS